MPRSGSTFRASQRNAERYDRFALLDLDATRKLDPAWFDAFQEYSRARARVPHVKATMRRLVSTQCKQIADDELRRISPQPTLLWGRHDRMAPLSLAERAAVMFGWPLHVIEDASHVPHMEQPDAFVQSLLAIGRARAEPGRS